MQVKQHPLHLSPSEPHTVRQTKNVARVGQVEDVPRPRTDRVAKMRPGKPGSISQFSEMDIIVDNHDHVHNNVTAKKKRVKNTIYPASDIIEEVEESITVEQIAVEIEQNLEGPVRGSISKVELKDKQKNSDKAQERTNAIVNSGGLIFLLVAAVLVTASFFISPTIETFFSKLHRIYLLCFCF